MGYEKKWVHYPDVPSQMVFDSKYVWWEAFLPVEELFDQLYFFYILQAWFIVHLSAIAACFWNRMGCTMATLRQIVSGSIRLGERKSQW